MEDDSIVDDFENSEKDLPLFRALIAMGIVVMLIMAQFDTLVRQISHILFISILKEPSNIVLFSEIITLSLCLYAFKVLIGFLQRGGLDQTHKVKRQVRFLVVVLITEFILVVSVSMTLPQVFMNLNINTMNRYYEFIGKSFYDDVVRMISGIIYYGTIALTLLKKV